MCLTREICIIIVFIDPLVVGSEACLMSALEINVALKSVDTRCFYLIDKKGDPAISFR